MRAASLSCFLVLAACSFEPGAAPRDAGDMPSDGDVVADADARPDAAIVEVTIAVAANNDDALQDPPPGGVLVAYSWISLYTADHWGAMRFALPQVQRGATILDAYLDVYFDSSSEDDPNVLITSEASATPAALTTMNNSIANRPRGVASVPWVAANLGAGTQRTPSLATIVQERVSDAGWAPGQYVMFIFDTQGPSFEMRQRDYAPAGTYAPTLTVRFTNP